MICVTSALFKFTTAIVDESKEGSSAEARSFSLNELGINFGGNSEDFPPLEHYPLWKIHKYHGVDLKPVHLGLELGKKKKDAVPFTAPPPLPPPSQADDEDTEPTKYGPADISPVEPSSESYGPPQDTYGPPVPRPSPFYGHPGIPSQEDQPSPLALQGLAQLDNFGTALGVLQGGSADASSDNDESNGFSFGGALRGFTSGLTSIPSFLQGLINGGQSDQYPPTPKPFYSTKAVNPVALPSLPAPPELPQISSLGALPNVPRLPSISLPPQYQGGMPNQAYRVPFPAQLGAPTQLNNPFNTPALPIQLSDPR